MRLTVLLLLASSALPSASPAEAPVFEITPAENTIGFNVNATWIASRRDLP